MIKTHFIKIGLNKNKKVIKTFTLLINYYGGQNMIKMLPFKGLGAGYLVALHFRLERTYLITFNTIDEIKVNLTFLIYILDNTQKMYGEYVTCWHLYSIFNANIIGFNLVFRFRLSPENFYLNIYYQYKAGRKYVCTMGSATVKRNAW